MTSPVADRRPNLTSTSDFLLLELSEVRELRILHFFLFLALYLTAITGNLLIVSAVGLDHHLHTPMYFFLMNLALMDMCTISVIIPKSMANSLMNSRTISYSGCVAQMYFFLFFGGSDFALLTIMAHDRYVAICNPLQYEAIMNKGACTQLAILSWICGAVHAIIHTCGTFNMTFCSHVVDQFFCEVPELMRLSCDDLYLVEVGLLVFSCSAVSRCFVFIITTYVLIFSAVLRMPSAQGRQKALSTCIPHLTVVSVFVLTGLFAYTKPPSNSSSDLDLGFAVVYTTSPSLLNPFIYSMRNKEIRTALWKLFHQRHFPNRIPSLF
ncbi:olfactory receptor 14I1-like [Tiliqua scincoides]|uniref:olfactory receptor 14I1-like n=1 Tax=Tiliqua scincoides TaxID=71010 RepID=UPI003461FFA9